VAGACGAVRSALPPVLTRRPRGRGPQRQCPRRKGARCRRWRRRRQ
jgi:hypothetical protein